MAPECLGVVPGEVWIGGSRYFLARTAKAFSDCAGSQGVNLSETDETLALMLK